MAKSKGLQTLIILGLAGAAVAFALAKGGNGGPPPQGIDAEILAITLS